MPARGRGGVTLFRTSSGRCLVGPADQAPRRAGIEAQWLFAMSAAQSRGAASMDGAPPAFLSGFEHPAQQLDVFREGAIRLHQLRDA